MSWLLSLVFLAHPLNFFTSSEPDQAESWDEDEEEEDIVYVPALSGDQESRES